MNEIEGRCDAVDGARLYFRSWGEGTRAVVLCDGILCEGFVWKYLRPALVQAGYRVVHWNYRGHGRSENPRDRSTLTIEDMARDAWRVGLGTGHLLGQLGQDLRAGRDAQVAYQGIHGGIMQVSFGFVD